MGITVLFNGKAFPARKYLIHLFELPFVCSGEILPLRISGLVRAKTFTRTVLTIRCANPETVFYLVGR